jgi:drug/metabolite transporter (DMT)-like permease
MTVFISYFFYFVAASASPLQRRWLASKKNATNTGQIHFAFQVTLVTVLLSLSLPFFQPFRFEGSPVTLTLLTVLAGMFGAGFFVSSFTAQKHVEAGVSTLVNNIYTPVTIVLASLFLSERLTPMQILGTILLFVGMVVVSKKHRIGTFRFDKYFLLMVLSGITLGISLTAERALQKMTGFSAGTMLSWWAQCAFLGIAAFVAKEKSPYSKKDISITGSLRFLQSLSRVVLLFAVGNLSLVSAVTTFKVVIIFVFAAIFLKERQDLSRKIIGSLVSVAGLLLMR